MADFLKGNYQLPKGKGKSKRRAATHKTGGDLTEKFEQSALAKLGGSLCFVMKKNTFQWSGETSSADKPTASAESDETAR